MTRPECDPPAEQDPAAFWEARYAGGDPIWSGRPNAVLETEAARLPPGTALDLGCGEGGDTAWLAGRGWKVTAVDISPAAIGRARRLVAAHGIPEQHITWEVADLASWRPDRSYDLVSACFLHSPLDFPRTDVLRRAMNAVAPGGHLLVVGHAAPPPWAPPEHADQHHHRLLTPAEEIAALRPSPEWHVAIAEMRSRQATGPDGEPGALDDTVVLLRRGARRPPSPS